MMQNDIAQNVAKNAGNMPEKPVFEISPLVFSDFLHKDAYTKHGQVQFLRKILFCPKMPEIFQKSLFLQIFMGHFPYKYFVVFHTKTLLITTSSMVQLLIKLIFVAGTF